jgi:hypothetical protein
MIKPGVHCVVPIHTTHKHIEGFDWPFDKSLRDAWQYASGERQPNYPMPAIRRRVNYASLYSVLRWIGYLSSGSRRF